jgi:hypothetical protein
MVDLGFEVQGARAVTAALSPLLSLQLRVTSAEPVAALALRCQVHIEVTLRRYGAAEQARLLDLFGEPRRWGQTLRTLFWTQTGVDVRGFSGSTVVDLPLPCTFDFNVAATKYFYALESGDVPLRLLFSGMIFYTTPEGALQIVPVPWEKEAAFRLPVRTWREMMDHHYADSAWLCLPRDVFDRLYQYKSARGLPTWEQALDSLLPPAGQ